jgi:glycosyltransferase involved in cell wall biosynthesis
MSSVLGDSGRPRATVSVALTTCEGEQHLWEQLESIGRQTLPPDEVIVCDDASTDATTEMVTRFGKRVPFPVRLEVNDERLGFTKNFEKAIALCGSDLIFLADQDDVWHPEKIATQVSALIATPETGAVFSDAEVVNENLVPLPYTLWHAARFTPPLQERFLQPRGALPVLLKRNVVSGMTLGFKARFRKLILPMPADWYHDAWIALLISAVAEVVMIPKRLVKYRQHDRQQVGLVRKGLREAVSEKRKAPPADLLQLANWYAAAHARLTTCMNAYATSASVLRRFQAKTDHLRSRAAIRRGGGRLRLLTRELLSGNYTRYGSGWRSFAVDAFLW